MGPQKTPGLMIIIDEEQKVIFRNRKGEIRSGSVLKGNAETGQWRRFLDTGENGLYILFPSTNDNS